MVSIRVILISFFVLCVTVIFAQFITEEIKLIEQKPSPRDFKLFFNYPKFQKNITVGYSIGERVPGDTLVLFRGNSYNYSKKEHVQITWEYPKSGYGSNVTRIELLAKQDSIGGETYLLAGGPGYKYFFLVLEAIDITLLNYNIRVFGFSE